MAKKFYAVDMRGKYYLQSKDKDLETPEARRLIYDPNDKEMYFSDGTSWVGVVSSTNYVPEVESGSSLWFYQDAAPTGWTIIGSVGDELLAVKGGSTYTTGGTQAGTWTQPSHSHSVGSHTHSFSGSTSYEIAEDVNVATGGEGRHYHTFSGTTGGASGTTGSSATSNTWRPDARVGILATKD